MIKAVIFDFDGTVSNRQKNAYDAFDFYIRKYFKDLDDMEYEAIMQDFLTDDCNGTITWNFRVAPFVKKYGDRLPENYEEEITPWFYDHMGDFAVLKDEIKDVVSKLKENYKVAILSNGNPASQKNKIKNVGIADLFDEILISGEVGINKPNKEIFEIMAERLGVKCEECLFVGDVFSTDILGAYRSKMVPVWIIEDTERPAKYYKGYRIEKLPQLFDILDKENAK